MIHNEQQNQESKAIWKKRLRLRNDPVVQDAMQAWWRTMLQASDNPFGLDKEMYTQLSAAMMLELSGDQDEDTIAETVEEDWVRDAKGEDYLGYEAFATSMFELTDMWSAGATPEGYASFLNLMRTICLGGAVARMERDDFPVIEPKLAMACRNSAVVNR